MTDAGREERRGEGIISKAFRAGHVSPQIELWNYGTARCILNSEQQSERKRREREKRNRLNVSKEDRGKDKVYQHETEKRGKKKGGVKLKIQRRWRERRRE